MIQFSPISGFTSTLLRFCSLVLFILFVLLVTKTNANAETGNKPGEDITSIAVMDVRASGPVSSNDQISGLSAVLTTAVSTHRSLRIVASADIREILGFEAQRQMLGCDNDSCMAEIAGALGVSYLMSSEVSRFGRSWLFTVVLLDVAAAQSIGRVTVRETSEEALLDGIIPAVQEVLAPIITRPASGASHADSSVISDAKPSRSTLSDRTWPLAFSGIGVAGIAGGGALYALSLSREKSMAEAAQDGEAIYSMAEVDRYQLFADRSVGMIAGGAALIAGSIAWNSLLSKKRAEKTSDLASLKAEENTDVSSLSHAEIQILPLIFDGAFGVIMEVRK